MQTPAVECPACKEPVSVTAFLDACADFWANLNLVRFTCPACKERTDIQLKSSLVSLGYVYAAGSPHFCGMIDVALDGLVATPGTSELVVEWQGATWRIAAPAPRNAP